MDALIALVIDEFRTLDRAIGPSIALSRHGLTRNYRNSRTVPRTKRAVVLSALNY